MSLSARLPWRVDVLLAVVAGLPAAARAQVKQPSGETMPQPAFPDEVTCCVVNRGFPADADTLAGLFKYHVNAAGVAGGDAAIDPIMNAHTTPGTFSPQCGLSGTIVLHGGGCKNALGWYNATEPATKPATIYPLVPADLTQPYPNGISCKVGDFCPLATRMTTQPTYTWADPLPDFAANIRTDPRWAKGPVGFALIGVPNGQCPQTKYSQAELNDKSPSGAPWVTTLIYQSIEDPGAYYIAFEDQPTCTASWKGCDPGNPNQPKTSGGNDGDFNDFVFYVRGLSCDAGGQPCTVAGLMGICAGGVTECNNGGMGTYCRQAVTPQPEVCDNIDNDCDGMVDNGDNLCPQGQVCSQGVCRHPCDDTEFPCAVGLTCDSSDGLCKDRACIGVTCGAGQICRQGTCIGGCDGVKCPHGQTCRLGACVAPCDGVTCEAGRICEDGACQPACGDCRNCASDRMCTKTGANAGVCVETGCQSVTCPAGQVCIGGSCKDGCMDVICPGGQACMNGSCTPVAPPDTGTGGAGGGGGSVVILGNGGAGGNTTSGAAGSGTGAGAGTGNSGGATGETPHMISTCKCETAEGPSAAGVALLLAGVAIAVRRSRRAPARARRTR